MSSSCFPTENCETPAVTGERRKQIAVCWYVLSASDILIYLSLLVLFLAKVTEISIVKNSKNDGNNYYLQFSNC